MIFLVEEKVEGNMGFLCDMVEQLHLVYHTNKKRLRC